MLPDLAEEPQARITMVEVYQKLNPHPFPDLQGGYPGGVLDKPNLSVERVDGAFMCKIAERITAQVVAMGKVRRPVRIRPVGRDQLDDSASASYSMQLCHYRHGISHVFDDVIANNFIELVVGERIRQIVQVVNHIGIRSWIHVHPDSAGSLIHPTPDV